MPYLSGYVFFDGLMLYRMVFNWVQRSTIPIKGKGKLIPPINIMVIRFRVHHSLTVMPTEPNALNRVIDMPVCSRRHRHRHRHHRNSMFAETPMART